MGLTVTARGIRRQNDLACVLQIHAFISVHRAINQKEREDCLPPTATQQGAAPA